MMLDQPRQREWIEEVGRRLELGNELTFTAEAFARSVNEDDIAGLKAFLATLVVKGTVSELPSFLCPMTACRRPLPEGSTLLECPYCHTDYREQGVQAIPVTFFRLNGVQSRDLRWMIVVHGMNSRAPWQEMFSWEIASRLKYSAPILIYKYGWATIDVLIAPYHRHLARKLGYCIRDAIAQARLAKRTDRPDIIAHSFGTRLFSLVLEDEEFADLTFGRIITAGSIIRPDFDWGRHVNSGRIEAVLNHVGAKDGSVPFAHYTIPGTGPGGKVGYTSGAAYNVRNRDFGHSDFFKPVNMKALIANGGLWHSFLTRPLDLFMPEGLFVVRKPWRGMHWPLKCTLRLVGMALFLVALPFSLARRLLDP
jgi:hypothetical protein